MLSLGVELKGVELTRDPTAMPQIVGFRIQSVHQHLVLMQTDKQRLAKNPWKYNSIVSFSSLAYYLPHSHACPGVRPVLGLEISPTLFPHFQYLYFPSCHDYPQIHLQIRHRLMLVSHILASDWRGVQLLIPGSTGK